MFSDFNIACGHLQANKFENFMIMLIQKIMNILNQVLAEKFEYETLESP